MPTLVVLLAGATACSLAWYAWSVAALWQQWWRARGAIAAYLACLSAIAVLAASLRIWLVPAHHAMYVDEPWYVEAACNLLRVGRLELCEATWTGTSCEPYAKGLGWPVLLAPWLLAYGCDSLVAIYLTRFMGISSVLLVAWAAGGTGATRWQSLLGAILLSLHPVHAAWSATAETNVPQATVWLLGIGAALRYVESARPAVAALTITSLSLATAIRPEALAPTLVIAGALGWLSSGPLRQRVAMAATLAIVASAAAVTALPLWSMNREISAGSFLSLSNVAVNLGKLRDQKAIAVHGLVGVLALIAAWFASRTQGKRDVLLLLPAALAAVVVALAYDRFHERMLLNPTVTLLTLSSWMTTWPVSLPRLGLRPIPLAVLRLANGTAVALVAAGVWFTALEAIATPAESQVLETRLAAKLTRLELPAHSLTLAEEPTVLAAAGLPPGMRTSAALADEAILKQRVQDGPTYFLCDMYCELGFQGANGEDHCSRVLETFAVEEVASVSLHDRNYVLYRLGNSPTDAAPRRCPRTGSSEIRR